ncbi:MAG TPA: sterol desaturase family protein [Polyangia bacterium]|jgi:sterol desaturase/sphingolipid hydroxylase (fatty acid hydroxylase superfamily)|nr:sterol desaturase family protein [Polyangia bacterium]
MRRPRWLHGFVTVALLLCAGCVSAPSNVDAALVRLSRRLDNQTSELRSTTGRIVQEVPGTFASGYSVVRGRALAFAAILLGGASLPIDQTLHDSPVLGVEWFLLDLLLMALIYVPIEFLWPQDRNQRTFRPEWTLDFAYFLSTHLPVQVMSLLIWWPATEANRLFGNVALQGFVRGLPWLVQFGLAVLVADLAEYAVHRLMHRVPFLWRFHAVHHSPKTLDWIAGSRAHFVDDLITRGAVLLPIVLLGFSQSVVAAYLVFVTLHATWTHCNFGPTSEWLEKLLVLPRHHHWHHAIEKASIDKNFAIHFPWIDRIFGTYYLPKGRWPDRYGLDGEELVPSFVGQTIGPFLGK